MHNRKSIAAIAAGCGLALAPAAVADTFNDLASFLAAAPGATLVNFDTLPGGGPAALGPIGAQYAAVGLSFPPGNDIISGFAGPVSPPNGWLNNTFVGSDPTFDVDITTSGIRAVGVHNVLFASPNGAVLRAYDSGGAVLESVMSDTDGSTLDFFGVTTDADIARVVINVINAGGWGLDDLYVGESSGGACEESFYGDADGFGFGAPEVDGAAWRALGGAFFTDYRDAIDLAMWPLTDIWAAPVNPTWTHNYTVPSGLSSANLHLYIAGFADIGAVDLLVDGTLLTTFDFPGQFETTHILDIPVPLSFIDGSTQFTLATAGGDGYIIDYARLDVCGDVGPSCPPCLADCDESGTLDFFDFLCFQNLFGTGDPCADCDGTGTLDFFDFLCFQNAFAAGCGPSGITQLGDVRPPSELCGVGIKGIPADPRPTFGDVTTVPTPLGDIVFSVPCSHRVIGGGWGSWSHGYTGDVYYTNGASQLSMALPSNKAFYFYAEPNPFALIEFEITDGTDTVVESINGSSGAKGYGFCGASKVGVRTTDGVTDFAVGEFGIAN